MASIILNNLSYNLAHFGHNHLCLCYFYREYPLFLINPSLLCTYLLTLAITSNEKKRRIDI